MIKDHENIHCTNGANSDFVTRSQSIYTTSCQAAKLDSVLTKPRFTKGEVILWKYHVTN